MSDIRREYEKRVGIDQDVGTPGRNYRVIGQTRYDATYKTPDQRAAERKLREATEDLTSKGCDEQVLEAFALALLFVNKDMEAPQVKELHKNLDRFKNRDLQRLSEAAASVQSINAHPFLGTNALWNSLGQSLGASAMCPDDVLPPEQRLQLATIRMYAELPDLIRTYISLIEGQILDLKRIINLRGNGPGRDSIKYSLIQYVRERTGGPNHEKLSRFLVAYAQQEDGDSRAFDEQFSRQALQRFEARYREMLQNKPSSDAK